MEYVSLRPEQVHLDPQNPRLADGTSNDKEAINRLLVEGYKQLLELARDLANRGEGNPAELPIVIRDGPEHVVLEGNRRFAALKLLKDPKLADDLTHRASFERIKTRGGDPPESLYCAIAQDSAEANPWITLRHTGANDGVGVRVWSAEQTARQRRRMKAPVDGGTMRSIAISDELTEAYQADTILVAMIDKVRTAKLTNIGRFFSGVVLTRMQFKLTPDPGKGELVLCTKHTAEELHSYFKWAFSFLDENSVDFFKNDELRGALLNNPGGLIPSPATSSAHHTRLADRPFSPSAEGDLSNSGPGEAGDHGDSLSPEPGSASVQPASEASDRDDSLSPESGSASVQPASDGTEHDVSASESGEDSPSGRRRDTRDERYLYSDVKLPNLSPNVQRLLREVKSLPINENYAIACVLARVILELSVSDPEILNWSGKSEADTLANKIRGCILKLDPNIDAPRKRQRQDLTQAHLETKDIGVIYLHQFMHNPSAKSDPHLARRFSTAFTPLLKSLNEAVG